MGTNKVSIGGGAIDGVRGGGRKERDEWRETTGSFRGARIVGRRFGSGLRMGAHHRSIEGRGITERLRRERPVGTGVGAGVLRGR